MVCLDRRQRIAVGLIALGLLLAARPTGSPLAAADPQPQAPLAEKYLLDGKLADGESAVQDHLRQNPADDQARFGLGVIQVLRAFEHLGQSLYRYGLRTEAAAGAAHDAPAGGRGATSLRDLLPQNPNPEPVSYQAARQIVQTWIDDLMKAEATLAGVKGPEVKLPLHVGHIKLDLTGRNRPVGAAFLFDRQGSSMPREVDSLVIGFDRGDVCWFRGYCHFLAGWGELLLAVDGQDLFASTAHIFFEKPETPYPFLTENRPGPGGAGADNVGLFSDAIAAIHLLRLPIKEPARPAAALRHFEATLAMAKEMWKFILAETDDDHEWIPNPRQKGVLGVAVNQEMVDTWLAAVDEAELVLKGKKLVPFWRGKQSDRGVNLRRMFTEPRTFDPILWVQGTAAAPYLERGEVTKFAERQTLERIGSTFGGGFRFAGFAFWFN
jgi:hypothetical protein